jgi:hypothetical protein
MLRCNGPLLTQSGHCRVNFAVMHNRTGTNNHFSIEVTPNCFIVRDANGQALSYTISRPGINWF